MRSINIQHKQNKLDGAVECRPDRNVAQRQKARCTDVLDSVSLCEISYRQFERTDALDHSFFWSWHDVYSIYRTLKQTKGAGGYRNGRWSKIARHSSSINRLSFGSVLPRNARVKCCSMWTGFFEFSPGVACNVAFSALCLAAAATAVVM